MGAAADNGTNSPKSAIAAAKMLNGIHAEPSHMLGYTNRLDSVVYILILLHVFYEQR